MQTCRHLVSISSRALRFGLSAVLFLLAAASTAHAHGGMAGPDELGPPLVTSAALAFVCYWAVILWPSSKAKRTGNPPAARENRPADTRVELRRLGKRTKITKRDSAALRKYAQLRRLADSTDSARRASDV